MKHGYERPEDRQNEEEIARVIEDKWDCKVVLTPSQSRVDGISYRQVAERRVMGAILEVKNRPSFDRHRHTEFYISKSKYDDSVRMAKACGVPFVLVIRDSAGVILYLKHESTTVYTTIGEFQRKGRKEKEPVYCINENLFHRI